MQYSISMTRLAEGEPLYPEDPDLPLVTAMAQGDAEALEELYRRRGPRLLAYLSARLGNPGLAEEVLQDVMLAAWQGAARFRGAGRAWAWLLAIARNRAINAYHRQVQPDSVVESEADMDAGQLEMPGEPIELDEGGQQGQALQQALSGLPAAQRETLELVFFQGLSLEETAQVMGVAEGTIKSRLHRARARLRGRMKDEG